MSGIAAALGGSKATLWSYFPSKEVLFNAVMDRATRDFHARLSVILSTQGDVEATLRSFCTEYLRKVTAQDGIALYRLVISEANRFPEVGRIFFERGPKATQEQLAEYLSGIMNRSLLRKADPLLTARQLLGLCLSGPHLRLLTGVLDKVTPALIDEDVERTIDIFMRGYAPE